MEKSVRLFREELEKKVNNVWTKYEIHSIFDHVQTHAVYGLGTDDKNEIERVKNVLRENGAKRFRSVKTDFGFTVLCFKI